MAMAQQFRLQALNSESRLRLGHNQSHSPAWRRPLPDLHTTKVTQLCVSLEPRWWMYVCYCVLPFDWRSPTHEPATPRDLWDLFTDGINAEHALTIEWRSIWSLLVDTCSVLLIGILELAPLGLGFIVKVSVFVRLFMSLVNELDLSVNAIFQNAASPLGTSRITL